ncbi:matrixin family metalloprotease [Georgenia sp. AZ-5]|uniref:matrixin family metalloprotease n=1 Tax=Georgenia sp. AZ-5 TaxID=3367526 RepID=UPI00375538D6
MGAGKLRDGITLGPARRRRRMRRLLPGPDLPGASTPRSTHGGTGRALLAVAVLVALAAGGYVVTTDRPLGDPPAVGTGVGTFAFVHQPGRPGVPVTYDPCEPIRYAVNDALAPAGGGRLVEEAVREVSLATGLVFEAAGTTEDEPEWGGVVSGVPPVGGWPPVVIAWSTPEAEPELAGDVAGVGGSVVLEAMGRSQLVTGGVTLDAPTLADALRHLDGEARVRAVIMHELGHVVGLGHVDDPAELMYEGNVGQTGWGPGDREGLAALGSGECL